jgi:hypothetical protein
MFNKHTLMEGTLRKVQGEWVMETHDKKLYKINDVLEPYIKEEVRFVVVKLEDLENLIEEDS